MKNIVVPMGEDPLALLKRCDGYYERPPGGPLVGYAGRDGQGRQYVGMVYANFAKGERHGGVLGYVAEELIAEFPELADGTGFCAAPEGGKALAVALAVSLNKGYIFPEKKVTALKTDTSREKSIMVWERHIPESDERWWIVEDTCNNFSTTKDLIALIEGKGAKVAGIVCFLNRSLTVDKCYNPDSEHFLPVNALVRKEIAEYEQSHPAVKADVDANNVVWKPKNEWDKLPKS